MRLDRFVAYAALAVVLASGALACESTSPTAAGSRTTTGSGTPTGGVGPPAPTGVGATPPLLQLASVTSVAPHAGSGGSQVTITGTGFTFATTVCFGGASSPKYQVSDSGTRITAVAPYGSGTVPVAVITASGPSAVEPGDTFTYRSSAVQSGPTSTALHPPPCAPLSRGTLP